MINPLLLGALLLLDTPERWHVPVPQNTQFIEQAKRQGVDGLSIFTISLKKPFGDCPQNDEPFSLFQNNEPWKPFDQARVDQLAYVLDECYKAFSIVRIVLFEEEIDTFNYFNDHKTFNPNNSRWLYVTKILELLNGRPAILTWEECTWSLVEIKKYLNWLDGKINKSTQIIALHNPNQDGDIERLFGGLVNTPLRMAEVQVTGNQNIVQKVQWLRSNAPELQVVVAEYPNLSPRVNETMADGYYFYYDLQDQTLNNLEPFNWWFNNMRLLLGKQQTHIRNYLLGRHSNSYGLDTNSDGSIDYADAALP